MRQRELPPWDRMSRVRRFWNGHRKFFHPQMEIILQGGREGQGVNLTQTPDSHSFPDHTTTVMLQRAGVPRQLFVPHDLIILDVILYQLHHVSVSTVISRDELGMWGEDGQRFNGREVGHALRNGKQDCHIAVFTSKFILQKTVIISVANIKACTVRNQQGCCLRPTLLHVVFMETDVVKGRKSCKVILCILQNQNCSYVYLYHLIYLYIFFFYAKKANLIHKEQKSHK